ncbi:heterokaryon incompatibility Het-C [Atractiella rhizophila]|nr:heterokaryon incompatibility Het-C [Atractiella rhizophila]
MSAVLWFSICLFLALLGSVNAFGAGEIPSFSYCKDSAYRHGDIESVLGDLVRWDGLSSGGGLLGAAVGMLSAAAAGGPKFSKADVNRVYFGNWLRDYSQAMDIAGLSKATKETIVLVLSVLGFMTFGFATEEFELTEDKLGVYLPVQHVDNPKGYGGNEDPRKYHPALRGPVMAEELEIDERTGLKNYIAREGESYDTSAAWVRRSLHRAIELAQQTGGADSPALFEAYRLMGGALHTLEDLLAHSNWCELTLKRMGHTSVFCHVGDDVRVRTREGEEIEPLVTGTFGGADFIFSIMGEAQDKLSESSIEELNKKMESANAQGNEGRLEMVKQLLSRFGGGEDDKVAQAEQIQQDAYHFDPNQVASEEAQRALINALRWRDGVMRDIQKTVENIPGLEAALEELTDTINLFVYSTIQPYISGILSSVSDALSTGSREVINQDDQYEVFNNPRASDPSHSQISKDHFDNILNDPAGRVAKVVVRCAVERIVAAWSDKMDPNQAIDEILETFHHPYFAYGRSDIQSKMAAEMENWFQELSEEDQRTVIDRLNKDSVREGENKRLGAEEGTKTHGARVGNGWDHSHGYEQRYQQPDYSSSGYGDSIYGGQGYGSDGYSGYAGHQAYSQSQESSGFGGAALVAVAGTAAGYFGGGGGDDQQEQNYDEEREEQEQGDGSFDFSNIAETIQNDIEERVEEEFYEE